MYLVQGIHPTMPGMKMSLYVNKTNADARAKELVSIIGDDIVNNFGNPDVADNWAIAKMNDWEGARDWLKSEAATVDVDEFDVWIEEIEAEDDSDPTAVSPAVLGRGAHTLNINDVPWLFPGDKLEITPGFSHRDHVQPLDPADLVVSTLVQNLANIIAHPAAAYEEGADLSDAIVRMRIEAETAMEAGQAWLDKARPIGRIAADVVRLAGIIVAGTDLHACLSEAMDQHIYDESNGEQPDAACGYTAALKGWTDALAGITVTTPAPARVEVPAGLCLPLHVVESGGDAYIADAKDMGTGICIYKGGKAAADLLEFVAKAVNAQTGK